MSNIFDGLQPFGFDNIDGKHLYNINNDIDIQKTDKEINHLFLKNIHCPVCENKFGTPSVKVNSPRVLSKDSDLFIRYYIINPYFYDVWVCPYCGYSAMKADFPKIRSYQIELVKERVTSKWKNREYGDVFTPEIAIERYKLALLNAMLMEGRNSTKAMICLKIAWMYRLLEDVINENLFLEQAFIGLNEAFTIESFPMYGLDRFSTMFLLGELCRRTDKNSDALLWFSKVITSRGASQKVKEMARDGRDKIKEAIK
ncbi:DUF2225 domain-containing protein [Clostridium septicum]|uniref:DUF2225 domain-containing protein n=1 Tax=Clostridium septicum TaxID=1504 RepID=UPI000FF8D63C|nr:DUF2225 domain-containing protein [Clostridium septicum]QAS60323.1 DUF2225 domain-containing protein [Clostridium septicum]